MGLSAAEMQEAVIKNLPEKTGKTLEEWIKVASSLGLEKNSEVVKKLKADYSLGHVQAQTIAWRMKGDKPYVETKGYEESIFKSSENMKRYQSLKKAILKLSEVECKPCKTYIPFYHKKQFAILTEKKGRLLLGLSVDENDLTDLTPANKLGGSDRINRQIEVENHSDEALMKYINVAYKRN